MCFWFVVSMQYGYMYFILQHFLLFFLNSYWPQGKRDNRVAAPILFQQIGLWVLALPLSRGSSQWGSITVRVVKISSDWPDTELFQKRKKYIVACQRGMVSEEPPWLLAAMGHGPLMVMKSGGQWLLIADGYDKVTFPFFCPFLSRLIWI